MRVELMFLTSLIWSIPNAAQAALAHYAAAPAVNTLSTAAR